MQSCLNDAKLDYLQRFICEHFAKHFDEAFCAVYRQQQLKFIRWNDAEAPCHTKRGTILMPIDAPSTDRYDDLLNAELRGVNIVLWRKLAAPSDKWTITHGDDHKLANFFYKSENKNYLPRFDLLKLIFSCLSLDEESQHKSRDRHGRFIGKHSPRQAYGLTNVPVVNNALAVLAEQIAEINDYKGPMAKKVKLCLSHDLDQLRGDDVWTQSARMWRFARPVWHGHFPLWRNFVAILRNFIHPYKYFADDLKAIIRAEEERNFPSMNYLLCGRRGRFLARTKNKHIIKVLDDMPKETFFGMHYNYDTHLQSDKFSAQKRMIERWLGRPIIAGRAHYLKMDAFQSPGFWSEQSITIDETLGYPDIVGYRAGLAGCFHPYDTQADHQVPILMVPLVAMDGPLFGMGKDAAINTVKNLLTHLSVVGGTFTFLIHPGYYNNPEFPELNGAYDDLLDLFQEYDLEGVPVESLLLDKVE